MPPSYIQVRAVVWVYGCGQTVRQTDTQTDTQMRVTTIHFVSSTTHTKCNKKLCNNSSNILLTNMCKMPAECIKLHTGFQKYLWVTPQTTGSIFINLSIATLGNKTNSVWVPFCCHNVLKHKAAWCWHLYGDPSALQTMQTTASN